MLLILLIVIAVSGTVFGVMNSLYHESPPVYRPMIYYDGINYLFTNREKVLLLAG